MFCSVVFLRHIYTVHYTVLSGPLSSTPNNTTLHYTMPYYITLHYTTPCFTTLHYTTPCLTTLHYTRLFFTRLFYTTLYKITVHYTTLQFITLYSTTLHYNLQNEVSLKFPHFIDSLFHFSFFRRGQVNMSSRSLILNLVSYHKWCHVYGPIFALLSSVCHIFIPNAYVRL